MSETIWSVPGNNIYYEDARTSPERADLRRWMDEAYYGRNLQDVLDGNFIDRLRNHDYYARLWEIELSDWLRLAELRLIPTNGAGPDFCVELSDGRKVWIEAKLATPDAALDELWRSQIGTVDEPGPEYSMPVQERALRYTSSLYDKARDFDPTSGKHAKYIGENDFRVIAVSAFPPGAMDGDIDYFIRAVVPVGSPVVHFTTDGSELDPTVARPTHAPEAAYTKPNGAEIPKGFLFPGTDFPFVDAVLFTEASNLQQLLGTLSASFSDETNTPHVFPNHAAAKGLPPEFTDNFYLHQFVETPGMAASLQQLPPKKKLM